MVGTAIPVARAGELSKLSFAASVAPLTSLTQPYGPLLLGVSGPTSFPRRAMGLARGWCCWRLFAGVVALPVAAGDLPPAPSILAQRVSSDGNIVNEGWFVLFPPRRRRRPAAGCAASRALG